MKAPAIGGVELRPVRDLAVLVFDVVGKPIPKGRPRVVRTRSRSGKAQTLTFTPERTVTWEAVVRRAATKAVNAARWPMLAGRIGVVLRFCGARANADVDNLAKSLLDALNGVVWVDDCQVRSLQISEDFVLGFVGARVEVSALPPAPGKARKKRKVTP